MSSCVISSTDQPACTPWEMTSFEVDPHPVSNAAYAGVTLPTIEQITAIEEQARQEGYAMGHAEGFGSSLNRLVVLLAILRDTAQA